MFTHERTMSPFNNNSNNNSIRVLPGSRNNSIQQQQAAAGVYAFPSIVPGTPDVGMVPGMYALTRSSFEVKVQARSVNHYYYSLHTFVNLESWHPSSLDCCTLLSVCLLLCGACHDGRCSYKSWMDPRCSVNVCGPARRTYRSSKHERTAEREGETEPNYQTKDRAQQAESDNTDPK